MPHVTADETPGRVAPARRPMIDPVTSPWGLVISDSGFGKLKLRFRPEHMEDRWVIQVTDPDQNGITSINISRSWTYIKFYTLHMKPGNGAVKIDSITWEKRQGEAIWTEEEPKNEAAYLCKAFLGCEFEALAIDNPEDFEPTFSIGSRRARREKPFEARTPVCQTASQPARWSLSHLKGE